MKTQRTEPSSTKFASLPRQCRPRRYCRHNETTLPPKLAIPSLDTHSDTAMSCAGVALELSPRTRCAKLREFWSRIHHGTANKKILSAFFSVFSSPLVFFLPFFFLFFSFRVVPLDTLKSFWNSRVPAETCAGENLDADDQPRPRKLFNFEFSFRHEFSFR